MAARSADRCDGNRDQRRSIALLVLRLVETTKNNDQEMCAQNFCRPLAAKRMRVHCSYNDDMAVISGRRPPPAWPLHTQAVP